MDVSIQVSAVNPANGIPGGTVQVRTGGEVQCQETLDAAGQATCRLHLNAPGMTPFIAIYLGQAPFLPGTSSEKVLWVHDPFLTEMLYENDFESAAGSEWSLSSLDTSPSGQRFLGQFGNDQVTLLLPPLANPPLVTDINVTFDLYLLGTWDGNQVNDTDPPANFAPTGIVGPDYWGIQSGKALNFFTTFSNWDALSYRQAFPMSAPGNSAAPRTGAAANNSLGYIYEGMPLDSTYHLVFTFHASQGGGAMALPVGLPITFMGDNLQPLSDESWGIDNIVVKAVLAEATHSFLPVVSR